MFKGVVRPPDEIVSMRGGDFYADFVANISLESNPIKVGDQSVIVFKVSGTALLCCSFALLRISLSHFPCMPLFLAHVTSKSVDPCFSLTGAGATGWISRARCSPAATPPAGSTSGRAAWSSTTSCQTAQTPSRMQPSMWTIR